MEENIRLMTSSIKNELRRKQIKRTETCEREEKTEIHKQNQKSIRKTSSHSDVT